MPFNLKKLTDANYGVLMWVFLCILQGLYLVLKYPFEINFGYEFGAVADAILDGKGYSNPWKFDSGPTAAVLPFLVYFHLFFFYLSGKTLVTFILISIVKYSFYGLSYYFLLKILRLHKIPLFPFPIAILFLVFFLFSPTLNFEHTGDLWLNTFFVAWLIYGTSVFFRGNKRSGFYHLAFFYLISPHVNPSIALAGLVTFIVISIVNLIETIGYRNLRKFQNLLNNKLTRSYLLHFIKYGLVFSILFGLSVSLWAIRNFVVFEKFIPTKSNLWMEYYLTNMKDPDGLLSYSTVVKYHPIGSDSIKEKFIEKGEIAMMNEFETIGVQHRGNNSGLYGKKILNRVYNALVFTEYDSDVAPVLTYQEFPNQDKESLSKSKLVVKETWTCLELTPDEFSQILGKLNIIDKKSIYNDWLSARKTFLHNRNSLQVILRSLVMGIVVTLSILFLFFTSFRSNQLFIGSVVFYVVYLIPYILVSHQLRYHRPLFVVQVILIYFAIVFIFNRINAKRNTEKIDHLTYNQMKH